MSGTYCMKKKNINHVFALFLAIINSWKYLLSYPSTNSINSSRYTNFSCSSIFCPTFEFFSNKEHNNWIIVFRIFMAASWRVLKTSFLNAVSMVSLNNLISFDWSFVRGKTFLFGNERKEEKLKNGNLIYNNQIIVKHLFAQKAPFNKIFMLKDSYGIKITRGHNSWWR